MAWKYVPYRLLSTAIQELMILRASLLRLRTNLPIRSPSTTSIITSERAGFTHLLNSYLTLSQIQLYIQAHVTPFVAV